MKKLWMVALLAGMMPGQTLIAPRQVKSWQQLQAPNRAGTSLSIRQVSLHPANNPEMWAYWEKVLRAPVYEQYRVAVVPSQRSPILITCGPGGRGCANYFPLWFNTPPRIR